MELDFAVGDHQGALGNGRKRGDELLGRVGHDRFDRFSQRGHEQLFERRIRANKGDVNRFRVCGVEVGLREELVRVRSTLDTVVENRDGSTGEVIDQASTMTEVGAQVEVTLESEVPQADDESQFRG